MEIWRVVGVNMDRHPGCGSFLPPSALSGTSCPARYHQPVFPLLSSWVSAFSSAGPLLSRPCGSLLCAKAMRVIRQSLLVSATREGPSRTRGLTVPWPSQPFLSYLCRKLCMVWAKICKHIRNDFFFSLLFSIPLFPRKEKWEFKQGMGVLSGVQFNATQSLRTGQDIANTHWNSSCFI